jgi:hypothetical protein
MSNGYFPFVVGPIRLSFPLSLFITEFLRRVTGRVPRVEQELLTLLEDQSSSRFLVAFVYAVRKLNKTEANAIYKPRLRVH